MKRTVLAAAIIILGGIAAYFFTREEKAPPPPPPPPPKIARDPVRAAPAVAAPTIRHRLTGVGGAGLPGLEQSDAPLLQALGELLGRKWLVYILGDGVIQRIVATVDNLPRERLPAGVMPLKPVPRTFVTAGKGSTLAVGARNSSRYSAHVQLVRAVDAAKLVALYVRFYPLFQRAYEALGNPSAYFNDRLVVAIDDLLAARTDGSDQARQVGIALRVRGSCAGRAIRRAETHGSHGWRKFGSGQGQVAGNPPAGGDRRGRVVRSRAEVGIFARQSCAARGRVEVLAGVGDGRLE